MPSRRGQKRQAIASPSASSSSPERKPTVPVGRKPPVPVGMAFHLHAVYQFLMGGAFSEWSLEGGDKTMKDLFYSFYKVALVAMMRGVEMDPVVEKAMEEMSSWVPEFEEKERLAEIAAEAREASTFTTRTVAVIAPSPPTKTKVATAATNTETEAPAAFTKIRTVASEAPHTPRKMVANAATNTEPKMASTTTTPSVSGPPDTSTTRMNTAPPRTRKVTPTHRPAPHLTRTNAVVIHGIRTDRPLSATLELLDPKMDRQILSGRWLVGEERRKGKKESAVVLVLGEAREWRSFCWLGSRKLRLERYEWERGRRE